MSSFIAILVVVALFLVALVPLALVAARIIGWVAAAIVNGVLIVGTAGYHAMPYGSADLQLPVIADAEPGASRAQCVDVIIALEQAGVILDRRSPPRLVVHRDRWAQLQESAGAVVLDCVRRTWPQGAAAPELQMRD